MSDQELIDAVARLWIDGGGDDEGIAWCWGKIQDRVRELTQPTRSVERRRAVQEEGK